MEQEIWKVVIVDGIEYPDYEVSSEGRFRSWKKKHGRRDTPKLLKPIQNPQGYPIITVRLDDRIQKQASLHKSVFQAFNGEVPEHSNPNDYYDVHHINSNRADARLCNLGLISHSVNIQLSSVGQKQKKKVIARDDDGNVVFEYESYRALEKATDRKYKRTGVYLAMRDGRKYKGLWFTTEGGIR